MREDTKVILVLVIATFIISTASILILMTYGPVGRAVETSNATFVISTVTTTTSASTSVAAAAAGGAGRSTDVIIDFNIVVTQPLTGYAGDTLITQVLLDNGANEINKIEMNATANVDGLGFTFVPSSIQTLRANAEENVDLIVDTTNVQPGSYLINIVATASDPKVTRNAFLFVDLIERGAFNKTIIVNRVGFSYDLFKENPECLELNEVLENAEKALEEGRNDEANELVESAIRACRDLITVEVEEPVVEQPVSNNAWKIALILAGIVLLIMIMYELLRPGTGRLRMRLFILIIVGLLYAGGQVSFTGFAAKQAGGGFLDAVSLQIIIGVDIILLLTYLRLRFTRSRLLSEG